MINIPTPHIEADNVDDVANTVLMPGDPMRAKFITEHYLAEVKCFNSIRGMLGFTGLYKGKKISVMGSGMGIPSSLIYYHELFAFYEVQTIIRIGTAGAIQDNIGLRDIVVPTAACTDSSINRSRFGQYQFCPTPDFDLLLDTRKKAEEMGIVSHFGTVSSSDQFYSDADAKIRQRLKQYGVLAEDMEAAGLFTEARRLGKRSLAIFTISDNKEKTASSLEREQGCTQMMELALEVAPK